MVIERAGAMPRSVVIAPTRPVSILASSCVEIEKKQATCDAVHTGRSAPGLNDAAPDLQAQRGLAPIVELWPAGHFSDPAPFLGGSFCLSRSTCIQSSARGKVGSPACRGN